VRFISHPRFLQPARIIAFDESGERSYQLPAMPERGASPMSKNLIEPADRQNKERAMSVPTHGVYRLEKVID
jgi:hypothetical protein